MIDDGGLVRKLHGKADIPLRHPVEDDLLAAGIPFEAVTPDIFGGTTQEFVSSSPRREVPSLVDGESPRRSVIWVEPSMSLKRIVTVPSGAAC
jgi:glutathione S-transferase